MIIVNARALEKAVQDGKLTPAERHMFEVICRSATWASISQVRKDFQHIVDHQTGHVTVTFGAAKARIILRIDYNRIGSVTIRRVE